MIRLPPRPTRTGTLFPHTTPFRSHAPAALDLVAQELRRFLFGRAADLADHDDRLGRLVRKEQLEHVDEVGAVDRIAADADRSRLAKARHRRLVHRFVSKRARTADEADRTLRTDIARQDRKEVE